ncbi:PREDICTED: uncharacterized protein LOC105972530 [Erythranthe guttata]|uniref:uncharacterized protein LOC105972530 n=1 Tax=Erythranthe guttata TaxID=4155 RepID=UPI00064DC398|nr:PREDICTED: uncharacterized protein LOC105972530 [Erythranthe guttata]|eukprot:XP_012852943.1 PREDICTED: uncharacterized protein LOC105972530 [Erythranthe guttata]
MKHPQEVDECFAFDVLDQLNFDFVEPLIADPLEASLCVGTSVEEEEVTEQLCWLDSAKPLSRPRFESLETEIPLSVTFKPSVIEPPKLELKVLPSHLKYMYLGAHETLPVIISSSLTGLQEKRLLEVLREHKLALGWTIADIKGISPTFCMHKIILEESHKSSVEQQRRLNPIMKEVVKKEIIKWLDAGIIFPISDSAWVSPVQCVPKKGGMTVIKNEKNELIPSRTVTGWRICMDYRKLNKATRKDHFPLPFIDQMLDRLACQEFYCFLDGYSGYNQIAIAPEDQDKTTFTFPFGTFAFRRMPFGLCNARATFQRCMMAIFTDMVECGLEIFMDDFSVFGDTYDTCLQILAKVLRRCEETNLVLNWEKCHFMVDPVQDYLIDPIKTKGPNKIKRHRSSPLNRKMPIKPVPVGREGPGRGASRPRARGFPLGCTPLAQSLARLSVYRQMRVSRRTACPTGGDHCCTWGI